MSDYHCPGCGQTLSWLSHTCPRCHAGRPPLGWESGKGERTQPEEPASPALTAEHHQDALDLDPDDQSALLALERLHERNEDWVALAEVLHRRVEMSFDADEVHGLLLRIATIEEDCLGDLSAAIGTHLRALEIAPLSTDSLATLERLYTMEERWPELVEVLHLRTRIVEEPRSLIDLLLRLALLHEEILGDADTAANCYRRVLGIDPEEPTSLDAMERLSD